MTNPITPPPELVEQWRQEHTTTYNLARQAARWGADQELEACVEWLDQSTVGMADLLREYRRPKPPTLKEQALEQLACIQTDLNKFGMGISTNTIRAALEALPND
jgi:hypothetical protein